MSRILVIDDEPGNRLIVKSRLCDLGYEVLTEENGATGLVEARSRGVDLVMIAASLGAGIDAIELCRRLKAIPETGALPVLIYSNLPGGQEEQARAYQAGCDAFVPKAQMPVLDQIVRVQLRTKAMLDDLGEQLRVQEQANRRLAEEHQKRADLELSSRSSGEQSLMARELSAGRPDGALLVDADGFVRSADRGACAFFGTRVEGRNLGSLAPATGLEAFVRDARTEAREGFRFDLPAAGRRSARSISASVLPLVTSNGTEERGLKVLLLLDAARRRLANEILRGAGPGVTRHQLAPLIDAARLRYRPEVFVGESESARAAREAAAELSANRDPLLLVGPDGVGKAHLGRTVHFAGTTPGAFLEVRCSAYEPETLEAELFGCVKGAFPEAVADRQGLFHLAADGTLFLEEVSALPIPLQERLALFLEEGRVMRQGTERPEQLDLRVVATSSQPLEGALAEGRFLPRLLELMGRKAIALAPLRERPEDVLPLALHFLALYGLPRGLREFDSEVLGVLHQHAWPGNVDELEECVRRACEHATDGVITRDCLPQSVLDNCEGLASVDIIPTRRRPGSAAGGEQSVLVQPVGPAGRRRHSWDITEEDPISLDHYEMKVLMRALEHVGGDKLEAARLLKVGKSTLYRKLKRFDLK